MTLAEIMTRHFEQQFRETYDNACRDDGALVTHTAKNEVEAKVWIDWIGKARAYAMGRGDALHWVERPRMDVRTEKRCCFCSVRDIYITITARLAVSWRSQEAS